MLRYLPGSDTRLSHYLVTDSPGSGESGPTRDAAWKKYAAIQSAVCQSALGPAINHPAILLSSISTTIVITRGGPWNIT